MIAPLVMLMLLLALTPAESVPLATVAAPSVATTIATSPVDALYERARLAGIMKREVLEAAYERIEAHGLDMTNGTLAIADMSQPSTAKRLVVIDLATQVVVLQTWVAHGQGSGGLMAERFSNRQNSHQTSLGLYRVDERIASRKHGAALLLQGLDAGLNDQARAREVIIHGADYVSEQVIARTGKLGRSWGCPAVSRQDMTRLIPTLANGGLLFVYAS